MDIVQQSALGIPAFLLYLVMSFALLALFVVVYLWITPYRELALVREGNPSAAASLSGAILGFVIPLAHAVVQAVSLGELALWALLALIVQILVFFVMTRVIPGLAHDIPAGRVAPGVLLGALSLASGILNAACMAD
jgi:putative membrane protein